MSKDGIDSNVQSVHPITGQRYNVPQNIDDKDRLDDFLRLHSGKQVVAIQGLGFVGAVMSVVCANAITTEYAVIGVDLADAPNFWKIRSINEGVFPLVADDPKIESYFNQAIEQQNLLATSDETAYTYADVIIVDINLDVQKESGKDNELIDYNVDLSGFENAIRSVGMHCRKDALIIVESTVPPGTCLKLVRPTIEACFAKRGLDTSEIKIGHSFERVMPGPEYIDSIQNFYRVYAGIDKRSADATEAFLKTIIKTDEFPLTRLQSTTASEMAKVLENSYRAMNIAFIVEWSRFAEEAGVNLYEVVDAIRKRPTHRNIMFPGVGVGGYCLTKDPLMASWARTHFFGGSRLNSSVEGVRINDQMPIRAFEFLQQFVNDLSDKKILMLGISYRQDVGDTRSSPAGLLYDKISETGAEITLHDPFVKLWEENSLTIEQDLNLLLKSNYDIIIFSTAHSGYRANASLMEALVAMSPELVYDTVGVLDDKEISMLGRDKVKVLGRGDL